MIKDPEARIRGKESWKSYYLLSLESPRIASLAKPGQFIMVRINPHPYPLLRRPFSIHSRDGKNIEIFFQKAGLGTTMLSHKEKRDTLDILGPLGKGFQKGSELEGREVVAVGGGRGIAPLFFLAQELRTRNVPARIFYGGKRLQDLPLRRKFEAAGFPLYCSTDDGSFGFKGLVSDYLDTELEKFTPACIFACGPEPMMKKISRTAERKKIPAEFSLESVMGCGFGACWGCVRKIKKNRREEWIKICAEGPVFTGEEIVWSAEEK